MSYAYKRFNGTIKYIIDKYKEENISSEDNSANENNEDNKNITTNPFITNEE